MGSDKTPDFVLVLPCTLDDGTIVNWIESKALFADMDTHTQYVNEQLGAYIQRWGRGAVIYWNGFVEEIEEIPELHVLGALPKSIRSLKHVVDSE